MFLRNHDNLSAVRVRQRAAAICVYKPHSDEKGLGAVRFLVGTGFGTFKHTVGLRRQYFTKRDMTLIMMLIGA